MYCSNCGTDAGQASFCPNCGTSLFGVKPSGNVEKFNLITAYKSMFKKYAQFNGRSRRSEYWLASVMNMIIVMAFYFIMFIPMMIDITNNGEPSGLTAGIMGIFGLLMFAYAMAILVPSLAMSVRRLHDTGRSGWFLLLNLIPYIGGIIIFVFSVLDSQPGANQYGPNPKGL